VTGTPAAELSEPPSGEQVALRHGAWSAVAVEVGGGLRALNHGGAPLLDGYAADEMASGGRGQPLIPWPNRLAGGRYRFGGREIEVPVDERVTGSAIHGLTRWASWRVAEHEPSRCAMQLRLRPQPAYPFLLDLRIEYALGDAGLEVTLRAANPGDADLPFGAGFHPYLTLGTPAIDDLAVSVPAASWLPVDDRGIPTGERRPVAGDLDLRGGPTLGGRVLDHCFTELERGGGGLARVRLAAPDGRAATLWMDEAFGYLMVFTGDTLAPDRRRRGLAVEPMTCAPDAFNSGDGLRVLRPGEPVVGRWGIAYEPEGPGP
jgi:aldose 1-epimerase